MLSCRRGQGQIPQSLIPELVLGDPPDEIGDRTFWYTVGSVVKDENGRATSFKIMNPATGNPFASYTRSGSASSSCFIEIAADRSGHSKLTGVFSSYSYYSMAAIKMLLAIGREEIRPAFTKMTERGVTDRSQTPKLTFDENIRIP